MNTQAVLNIESMKVVKSTATKIRNFVYENKAALSNEMKLFYGDVASIVERNASKPKGDYSKITNIKDVLERAYNIEKYILAAGAVSYEVKFE